VATYWPRSANAASISSAAAGEAHRRAYKLADKYGEEFVAEWRLKTKWLSDLAISSADHSDDALPCPSRPSDAPHSESSPNWTGSHTIGRPKGSYSSYSMAARNRASARYAMMWRPTFLAVVALSYEILIGCKAAGVSHMTVTRQRKLDPEFDAQVIAAQAHCISLLHAMSLRSAIEGDCEPVFWQGIRVGHIRKFDNRLRIELLRAHLPAKFKTPGSQAPLIAGDNNRVMIMTPERQDELIRLRREQLEAMRPKELKASNEAFPDSGNSSGGVQ
jgi:hypothetical protein